MTATVSGTCTHRKVSTLRHAVPFNKRLVFFSDSVQFELESVGLLTPKSASTQQLTEYDCSPLVSPLGIGSSLYFMANRGQHSVCYGFFVTEDSNITDASDITSHVPEYVPKDVFAMDVSALHSMIVALSHDEPNAISVYQFYMNGQERLQSAWHKWLLPVDEIVRAVRIIDSTVVITIERAAGVFIETLTLGREDGLPNELYSSTLDRKFIALGVNHVVTREGAGYRTAFPLPYEADEQEYSAVVLKGQPRDAGRIAAVEISPDKLSGSILGDFTGCDLVVGRKYTFLATVGNMMVREQIGGGSVGVSRGRTQIARMWVNYAKSATFAVRVALTGREVVEHRATGRTLGTTSAIIGEVPLQDGRFGCPVYAQNTNANITLINDTPLPSTFLSVDWEGYQVTRGRNV